MKSVLGFAFILVCVGLTPAFAQNWHRFGTLPLAFTQPQVPPPPPQLSLERLYTAIASSKPELRAAAILALIERRQRVPCQTEASLLTDAFEAAQRSERRVPLRLRDPSSRDDAQKLLSWLNELPLDALSLQRQVIAHAVDRGFFPLAAGLVERLDLSPAPVSKCSSLVAADPLAPFETVANLMELSRQKGNPELLRAVHAALIRVSAHANPAGLAMMANSVPPEDRLSMLAALAGALQGSPVEHFTPREFEVLASQLARLGEQFAARNETREPLWTAARSWFDRYFRSAACRSGAEFERRSLQPLATAWPAPQIEELPPAVSQIPGDGETSSWKSASSAFSPDGISFLRLWIDSGEMIRPDSNRTREWYASYERQKKAVQAINATGGEFGMLAKSDGLFVLLLLSPRPELTQNAGAYTEHLTLHIDRPVSGLLLFGQVLSHVRLLKNQNREAFHAVVNEAARLNSPWLSVLLWLAAPDSFTQSSGTAPEACATV